MEHYSTKAYLVPRTTAVCIALLVLAANGLGYTKPNELQSADQHVVCVGAGVAPVIQFSKGHVVFQSLGGYETNDGYETTGHELQSNPRNPANGDTVITGADGFVSIILASGQARNLQPNSSVTFDSSEECQNNRLATSNEVRLESAYLSAAIRG